jgi:hypothetical protein
MKKLTPQQLLTLGLQKGFGGQTEITQSNRAGFSISVSHLEDAAEGMPVVYHDEWAADRAGGGQELVRVGEQQFTRVYAGGTVSLAALAAAGITKADVMAFLIKMITQLGDKTRLEADCPPIQDCDWQYEYTVKERLPEIPLTTGKEVISYKGEVVFVHWFLLTEVN